MQRRWRLAGVWKVLLVLAFTCCWMAVVHVSAVRAAVSGYTSVVAVTGSAAPDGNGVLSSMLSPVINDHGQVMFLGTMTGTSQGSADDTRVLRYGSGGLVQLAAEGQLMPDGNGRLGEFVGVPGMNELGQAVFGAAIVGAAGGGSSDAGIFRVDENALVQVARVGQQTPNGNGRYSTFSVPNMNDAGQVAFRSQLVETTGGAGDNVAVFRVDDATVVELVRTGAAAPDGNGNFQDFLDAPPNINNAGQTVFLGALTNTVGGYKDNQGIFRVDGNTISQVVRGGELLPTGDARFASFGIWANLNESGQTSFWTNLADDGGFSKGHAIYRDDVGSRVQIVRQGQVVPNGYGQFFTFPIDSITQNNQGQVLFKSTLEGTAGLESGVLIRADGASLVEIVRTNQTVPDGNGRFGNFGASGGFGLNDAGQIAFQSMVMNSSGGTFDNSGVYFFDDSLGMLTVAREGQAFLGSTFIGFRFRGATAQFRANEYVGMNVSGPTRLAFQFFLADGREGIAVWSPPLTGDFNGDGSVNAADYTVWRNGLGTTYDMDDYAAWKNNYGSSIDGEGSGGSDGKLTNVPEPGAYTMLLLSVCGLFTVARRKRFGRLVISY